MKSSKQAVTRCLRSREGVCVNESTMQSARAICVYCMRYPGCRLDLGLNDVSPIHQFNRQRTMDGRRLQNKPVFCLVKYKSPCSVYTALAHSFRCTSSAMDACTLAMTSLLHTSFGVSCVFDLFHQPLCTHPCIMLNTLSLFRLCL